MASVEERVELTTLLDFYGPLLTEHRREVLRLCLEEDLSLAEIAAQLGITRQGVSDALQNGIRQLRDYESKLGLAERYRTLGAHAQRCMEALEGISVTEPYESLLEQARQELEQILRER